MIDAKNMIGTSLPEKKFVKWHNIGEPGKDFRRLCGISIKHMSIL